ncbi:Fic family protein [Desulfocurvus vexinensis]|uniref:Fic family protein n=1 Tax=Desulfocurvus vexinensis TaxID=399548 RepID=UPI0006840794|nr:Fic family protein [Desulfocurvus vexinensis]
MKFEAFTSGRYVQQYRYKSFSPALVDRQWLWEDPRINTLLEGATRSLAELNAFSLIVPDVDRFIMMHIVKEANTSSKIEGTKTEIDEVLMDKVYIDAERKDDWQEVQNYIRAISMARGALETLPLSMRLLRETHGVLLDGVRGERKTPGEFRRSQNWIGGATLSDAVFIPPHHTELPGLLSDLEKFWHDEQIDVPHLIRVAISHYQFETIHPFLDGNGRIGRLLITLYLMSKGLLIRPSLYLSAYLERHKGKYYDALTVVRESNDIGQWVRFFLVAIRDTSRKGIATFKEIMRLRDSSRALVLSKLGGRSSNGLQLLDMLYARPVLSIANIAEGLQVSRPTAGALVKDFEAIGLLSEATGRQRYKVYRYEAYLDLFREKADAGEGQVEGAESVEEF